VNFPRTLALAFAVDGRRLLSVNNGGELLEWALDGDDPPRTLSTHQDRGFAVAPGDRTLASVSGQVVSVREVGPAATRRNRHMPDLFLLPPVAFSPNGRRLAVTGQDDRVLVWDLEWEENPEQLPPERVRQIWEQDLTRRDLDGRFLRLL